MKRGICILTAFALAAGLAGCQSRAGETRAAAAEGRTLADTEAVQKAREETEAKEAEGKPYVYDFKVKLIEEKKKDYSVPYWVQGGLFNTYVLDNEPIDK